MRSNSGGGKGKNNLHDPTLKEHEAEKGRSGGAVHGSKGTEPQPSGKGQSRTGGIVH